MNTLPNDTMTERALQQMRDTVASTNVPVLPAGQPSVAAAQPTAAAPSQPTETKPAETENQTPKEETSEETTNPKQSSETPPTAAETVPAANKPEQKTVPAAEGQSVSPTGAENPWKEAAVRQLAEQQMRRLFERKNGTESPLFSFLQPTRGGQIPPAAPVEALSQAAAQPVQQPAGGTQTNRQGESVRVAESGYGDVQPILDRLEEEKVDPEPYRQKEEEQTEKVDRANEDYREAAGNPLADIVLEKQKPVSDEEKKKRLRLAEKLIALNNIFAAISQGIGGISVGPVDNSSLGYIRGQLQRLDDLYRNEKNRYDQNELLNAMRKDKAAQDLAKYEAGAAADRQAYYRNRYNRAVEGNREIAKKQADIALQGQKYSTDMAYKYEKQRADDRNRAADRQIKWHKENRNRTVVRNYSTGEYDELTPERRADIAGVVDLIMNSRESAKKGPYGEWIPGKKPEWMNNELTDEELADLRGALKNDKLTSTQEGLISRLYNRMVSGGFYDPEAEHPYGVAPKPETGYAASVHKQYVDYVRSKHDWMVRTKQSRDNTITIKEAREIFGMPEPTPDASVRKVLKEAGLTVVE